MNKRFKNVKEDNKCNFCGRAEHEVGSLYTGTLHDNREYKFCVSCKVELNISSEIDIDRELKKISLIKNIKNK